MNLVDAGWVGVAALVVLFGGIALLLWIDGRNKARERQTAQTERLKALELGQTLPDAEIARASAQAHRAWAAGLVALLVPFVLAGAAVGATALIFRNAPATAQLPLLCVVWGICGLVALVAVTTGLGVIATSRGESPAESTEANPPAQQRQANPLAAAIREDVSVP